jgi:hypothetical protein
MTMSITIVLVYNIQIVSLILKRCACISFIYSKIIIMDIAISFEKWRGSQLISFNLILTVEIIIVNNFFCQLVFSLKIMALKLISKMIVVQISLNNIYNVIFY